MITTRLPFNKNTGWLARLYTNREAHHYCSYVNKASLYSAHSWLRSYLNNKTQRVAFQGCLSSSGPIKVGVPQGSILGPLLFSIYVNDLPSVISLSDINNNMYADDTELHFSHGDLSVVEKTLQADVENVST